MLTEEEYRLCLAAMPEDWLDESARSMTRQFGSGAKLLVSVDKLQELIDENTIRELRNEVVRQEEELDKQQEKIDGLTKQVEVMTKQLEAVRKVVGGLDAPRSQADTDALAEKDKTIQAQAERLKEAERQYRLLRAGKSKS